MCSSGTSGVIQKAYCANTPRGRVSVSAPLFPLFSQPTKSLWFERRENPPLRAFVKNGYHSFRQGDIVIVMSLLWVVCGLVGGILGARRYNRIYPDDPQIGFRSWRSVTISSALGPILLVSVIVLEIAHPNGSPKE